MLKDSRTGKVPISVEIEPPALGSGIESVFKILDPLVEIGISHIDITYHQEQVVDHIQPNGKTIAVSQRKKPGTLGIAGAILGRYGDKGIMPVPHAICTGFTIYDTEEFLVELNYLGVENILALRGDPAKGENGEYLHFNGNPAGHRHANELIQQIVYLRHGVYAGAREGEPIKFCVGAACYPELHAESPSLEEELQWLKNKTDMGADYLVTQMFFDNTAYKEFVEKARNAGINVPIVPGIKPLATYSHLELLPRIFNCTIPKELSDVIEKYKDDKTAIRKAGIEWCVEQCHGLLEFGVPSLHFYAARKAPVKEIIEEIKQI